MAKMRPFLACLILLFIGFSAQAQFYTTGSESASIRFNSIKDSSLELIYPEGHDSLALDWKQTLLKYVPPTSVRLPVVLHTSLSTSSGMVAYPPLRMDLYTSPDMYNPVAVPWRDHLIIHESRHVEQINFGFRRPFRWMGVLTGGISEALVSALYNERLDERVVLRLFAFLKNAVNEQPLEISMALTARIERVVGALRESVCTAHRCVDGVQPLLFELRGLVDEYHVVFCSLILQNVAVVRAVAELDRGAVAECQELFVLCIPRDAVQLLPELVDVVVEQLRIRPAHNEDLDPRPAERQKL